MADYIVKSGGSATGDAGRYASEQTGSFATLGSSNYYNSIEAAEAATTPPTPLDRVLISDAHAFVTASVIAFGIQGVAYVCVSDLAMQNSRRSGFRGSEFSTGTADVKPSNAFMSGLKIISADNVVISGNFTLYDCEVNTTGSADISLDLGIDGISADLINTIVSCDSSSGVPLLIRGGNILRMTGGKVATISAGLPFITTSGSFVAGGGSMYFQGVDLTEITTTLIANVGGDIINDDSIEVKFDLCTLAPGVAFTNEVFKSYNQRALFTRCSSVSAETEYQYHLHAFGGDVTDDNAIFRNEDEAFTESNQKISYKIETNSDASLAYPLWFEFPVLRYTKLSVGATDTLRFYITSNSALTDKDFYISVSYPDGTNNNVANNVTSAPVTVGGTIDLMAAATTLTADGSSSWTGALSNLYQIDVNTSVDAGADCQPIVKVYITKPSITIQIASEYGLN